MGTPAKDHLTTYLTTPEAKQYRQALDATSELIDGLESPFGMELLATVDWLVNHEKVQAETSAIRKALQKWPGEGDASTVRLCDQARDA
jgi:hypothetical protein